MPVVRARRATGPARKTVAEFSPRGSRYTVLFGGAQSFDPSGTVGTGDPVRPLITAIDRALSASVLTGDTTSVALSLWVTLHGLVTLEPAGALDTATADATFRSAILAALRGWTIPAAFGTLAGE